MIAGLLLNRSADNQSVIMCTCGMGWECFSPPKSIASVIIK